MHKSIVLIEDEEQTLQILERRIKATDHLLCIGTYQNAEDAIAEIPPLRPDLIVVDIGLPAMNGIECLMRIKGKCPDIHFLVFTIYDDNDHLFSALKAGADGYILKDKGPSNLVSAIDEFFAGGAPMSSGIARRVMESFHRFGPSNPHREALTTHQLNILRMIADGLMNKEIAVKLNITEGSVKVHINRIYKRLQVANRVEAVNKYLGQNRV